MTAPVTTPAATLPGAPTEPDALDGLARVRLRPGVAVTPLQGGLHLRGWRSGVTLEGSRALPALWQLLAAALETGDHAALVTRAPAGTPLRAALNTLLGHLRAHDLLVDRAGSTPDWLHAAAARPGAAAAAVAAAHPRILDADPAGPFARAAARALSRAGATPTTVRSPGGFLLLTAGPGGATAVGAALTGDGGFVTAPGTPAQVAQDARTLTVRLGPPTAATATQAPAAQTALLAGAAAHRLLCAVAGLPDPAAEGEDDHVLPGVPAVLVATAAPLRASYRSWLGPRRPAPGPAAPPLAPPDTLAQAMHRLTALTDERLGVLPEPLPPGTLSQLLVARVSCPAPGGTLLAAAARTDLARLDALCRAAELHLGGPQSPGLAVGATEQHAWGRALRRATATTTAGEPLPDRSWTDHPQARYWWHTLTARLHQRAELVVARLAPGVHAATVRLPGLPSTGAVEATAGDAAAFAALGAVARTVSADLTHRHLALPSGAGAALAVAGLELTSWEDEGWTTGWLAAVADREPALLTALHELTGLRAAPADLPRPDPRGIAGALRTCGYTVLTTTTDRSAP
ncbi:hypothetical protein ACFW1A_08370 [Kitasatospora sp. NPDC058965]|uniref:hypothetical protein n=1 Tax=Kitasatospora sp. NPDC058965 TaxID=3346682 RepID=UPI0036B746BB